MIRTFERLPKLLCLVLILLGGGVCQARVFNFKEASIAPYLRATGGLSAVHQSAFEHSSGTDTSINGSSKFDYSGELGILFGLGTNLHLRLGAELIQHRPVSQAAGLSPAGVQRFQLDSTVSAFNPNATFEYVFQPASSLRFFGMAGFGISDVTVDNKYTMTAQGTADYGVTDYTEKLSGKGTEFHAGVGLETLFTDNVTCALDMGYRYMPIKTLTYKGDVNSIVAPAGAHKGDTVLNADGTKRSLDMSGVFVGINFRFYLNFL